MHKRKGQEREKRFRVTVSSSGRGDAGLQESARVTEGQGSCLLRSGSRRSYRNWENFSLKEILKTKTKTSRKACSWLRPERNQKPFPGR